MIFKGSRYSGIEVVEIIAGTGTRTTRTLAIRAIPPAPSALEYTVVEGERLDTLAARFYSEATKYWLLLDANPEMLNPFELLVPGATIHVPKNRLVGT
jgi:nucleoid-associated protein YgaU